MVKLIILVALSSILIFLSSQSFILIVIFTTDRPPTFAFIRAMGVSFSSTTQMSSSSLAAAAPRPPDFLVSRGGRPRFFVPFNINIFVPLSSSSSHYHHHRHIIITIVTLSPSSCSMQTNKNFSGEGSGDDWGDQNQPPPPTHTEVSIQDDQKHYFSNSSNCCVQNVQYNNNLYFNTSKSSQSRLRPNWVGAGSRQKKGDSGRLQSALTPAPYTKICTGNFQL